MNRGKIVIFTMNGGHGTMAPSLALADYLKKKKCEATVIDIMAEANPLGAMLGNMYNFLLRKSLYSAAVYMEFAHAMPIDKFAPFNTMSRARLASVLSREKPDGIVMICPWISKMIIHGVKEYEKNHNKRPFLVMNVVDLGAKMPTSWVNNDTDETFLSTENAERFLLENGLDGTKAEVMGVPLHAEFGKGPISTKEQASAREKYKLGADKKVITILGGREGVSNTEKIVKVLSRENDDAEFVVQCGMNEKLLSRVEKFGEVKKNVHPCGFVDSMRELYSLSDVAVTKPGAITVSELVVSGIPFVLDAWPIVMPQEKGNVEFVHDNKFGLVAHDPVELQKQVRSLLSGDLNLDKSRNKAQKKLRKNLYGTEKIGDRIIAEIKNR